MQFTITNHHALAAKIVALIPIIIGVALIGCDGDDNGGGSPHYWHTQNIASFGHLPIPSPNGRWIAFAGTGDSTGIWVFDRNSGDVIRLSDNTNPHRWDYRWLPSSGGLVFGGAGESGTETAGIWMVSCPDAVITRLSIFGGHPDPMPSGEGVCFSGLSTESEQSGIWTVELTTPEYVRLSENGDYPRYSPFGFSIAYLKPTESNNTELRLMSHEGFNDRLLMDSVLDHQWSDEQTIICTAAGSFGINVVMLEVDVSAQPSTIINGGSQVDIADVFDLIVFQNEVNHRNVGLHVTTSGGGGSKAILGSGAYPKFLPGTINVVFENTGGIFIATIPDSIPEQPSFGVNP
jgi:hypothetical protein